MAFSGLISWLFRSRLRSQPAPVGFETWTIPGIRFNDQGYQAGDAAQAAMTWTDAFGSSIQLKRTDSPSGLNVADIAQARIEQRHIAIASGRSIVSVEMVNTPQGVLALETVTKAQRGLGFDYIGTLLVADRDCHYDVRIAADEGGMTGTREALVTAHLAELGEIELAAPSSPDGSRRIKGWYQDPYDEVWDDDAICSVTDDERVDVCFPEHPLTRVRAFLRQLRASLVLDEPPDTSPPQAAADRREPPLHRAALSAAAVREMLWTAERFAEIEALLDGELAAADLAAGSPDTAERLLLLGIVQVRMNRHEDAIESLSIALSMFQRLHENAQVKTAVTLGHLARANLDLGNLSVATGQFREALPFLEQHLPGHWITGAVLSGYGRLLLEQDKAEGNKYVIRADALVTTLGGGERFFKLQEFAGAPPPTRTARITIA